MNCPSVYMHLLPFHVVDSYQLCESICIHMDGWIDRQTGRQARRQTGRHFIKLRICLYGLRPSLSLFYPFFSTFCRCPGLVCSGEWIQKQSNGQRGEGSWVGFESVETTGFGHSFFVNKPSCGMAMPSLIDAWTKTSPDKGLRHALTKGCCMF